MPESITCYSCGAECPDILGETHAYMLSAPGCWTMYGEVLAREYSDVRYFKAHQHTVDAYACQHPGKAEPRSINSIGIHLCSLYFLLEKRAVGQEAISLRQKLSALNKSVSLFYWLDPPQMPGEITVREWVQQGTSYNI